MVAGDFNMKQMKAGGHNKELMVTGDFNMKQMEAGGHKEAQQEQSWQEQARLEHLERGSLPKGNA
jgi:hypothetical protein